MFLSGMVMFSRLLTNSVHLGLVPYDILKKLLTKCFHFNLFL